MTVTLAYTGDGTPITSPSLGEPLSVTDNLGKTSHLRHNAISATDMLGYEADMQYNIATRRFSPCP